MVTEGPTNPTESDVLMAFQAAGQVPLAVGAIETARLRTLVARVVGLATAVAQPVEYTAIVTELALRVSGREPLLS